MIATEQEMTQDSFYRWLAVVVLFLFAMLAGITISTLRGDLQEIQNSCEVFDDGAAICQDGTFEWKEGMNDR